MEYCQNLQGNKITKEDLGIGSNTTSNSEPNKNNTVIYTSLVIGAFILGGIFVYFLVQRKKGRKNIK